MVDIPRHMLDAIVLLEGRVIPHVTTERMEDLRTGYNEQLAEAQHKYIAAANIAVNDYLQAMIRELAELDRGWTEPVTIPDYRLPSPDHGAPDSR
jgi:hypothetical protein